MSSASIPNQSLETSAITSGRQNSQGALAPTIWPSTTFEIGAPTTQAGIAKRPRHQKFYGRHGNQSTHAFESAIAELEGAEAALAFSSGMGALSSAILAFCPQGSHIVAQKQSYGGTLQYLNLVAKRLGLEFSLFDANVPGDLQRVAKTPNTTLILAETPANPNLDIVDLDELAAIKGPIKLVDATFATPLGQTTLRDGIDMVMHSATKGIAGHNDATIGVISAEEEIVNWLWGYSIMLGTVPSPYDATNALRGLRTLGVRLRHQSESALAIACALESLPQVARVSYPGLVSHPQHETAKKQMRRFGSLLTIHLAGDHDEVLETASAALGRLRIVKVATSLGGPETLVTHPATTTHAGLSPEELFESGIGSGTLRISVGLEDACDLIGDFSAAITAN